MKKIFIQEEFDYMSNSGGEHYAKIKVIGVGGGGMNAVNRMIASGLGGVDFIAMNTDVHVLELCNAKNKLQLGSNLTRGLGAGGAPSVGRESAEESKPEIRRMLEGADMIFIAAGLGGGTGTGAAPVIAEMSREAGILTVAVVTKPFTFEGPRRAAAAEQGVNELKECVDTLIVIPNDRLLNVVEKKATLNEAFSVADDVLRQGVQGISDIITIPGLINVDFADVKAIMQNQGTALMGIGIANGENRATQAAEIACASPLLETTIDGACGILLNVTGGPDLTLSEVYEAAEIVYKACDIDSVNVIFGAVIDPEMANQVKITVVATGFDGEERRAFMRAKASAAIGEQGSNSSSIGFDAKAAVESLLPDDELEIPTFLRRGR